LSLQLEHSCALVLGASWVWLKMGMSWL